MNELGLYIWDNGKLKEHAVAIVIAYNEEEAKRMLEDEYGELDDEEKATEPEIYECPNAFVYYFD